jgi:hypothetical protein
MCPTFWLASSIPNHETVITVSFLFLERQKLGQPIMFRVGPGQKTLAGFLLILFDIIFKRNKIKYMAKFSENIILPKALIKKGVAILPLEEWERIKENLEMLQSKKLLKEIEKAREEAKEGKTISLKEVERKLNL